MTVWTLDEEDGEKMSIDTRLLADAGRMLIVMRLRDKRHGKLDRELKNIGAEMIFTPSDDPLFAVLKARAERLKKEFSAYDPTDEEITNEAKKITRS